MACYKLRVIGVYPCFCINAYDAFDGHDEPGSTLEKGFEAFGEYFSTVPVLASDELLDEFKENF